MTQKFATIKQSFIGIFLVSLALTLCNASLAATAAPGIWHWQASGAGVQTLSAVTWDGARFVASTEEGQSFVSEDGVSWSETGEKPPVLSGTVAWNGSKVVALPTEAGGQKGLHAWKDAHLDAVADEQIYAVCAGVREDSPIFVAVGQDGAILTSRDGAKWTSQRVETDVLHGVAWGGPKGQERFVAVGQRGVILTSSDGFEWARAQKADGDDLYAVAWCGSRFFAVGAAGAIVGSQDGLAWQAEDSPVSQWLYAIAWSGQKAVAVGEYGSVAVAEATPAVTSVSPNAGPLAGGTSVTITGTGFTGATEVDFGANPATSVVVASDTQITCKSPAHAAATVHVTVTTSGGTSGTSTADQFTYYDLPTVTAVSPSAGLTAGGTVVHVTGTNFAPGTQTTVYFGAIEATSVAYIGPTSITAVSPAQAAAVVDVTVKTPGGTSATSDVDKFTYVAPLPVVLSVDPASGPLAGGTTVTVTGVGLTAATSVLFGQVHGTAIHVTSDTTLTVVSPAQAAGTVDVLVTTAGGTSPAWEGDEFTYESPSPTVTALNPASGPVGGGTVVNITGTNFVSGATVKFGAASAAGVAFISSTKLTAVSPAGTGVVDVTVTTSSGTSPISAASKFSYVAPPTLSAITPNAGATGGGTAVTLTGTGFISGATVAIGGVPCTKVVVVSATSITAVTGAHDPGTVDVKVTNPDTQMATLTGGFTYSTPPAILGVSKLQNPFRLKLIGTSFHASCTVYINGTAVQTTFKNAGKVIAKKGSALQALLPKGVTVQITIKNLDDGIVSDPFPFAR